MNSVRTLRSTAQFSATAGWRRACRCLAVTSALLLLFAGSVTAAESAPAPVSEKKPSFTTEQASLMDAMRREVGRLDPMLEKVDDAQHKAWVKVKVDLLKGRFESLEKSAFDPTKFDELRFDVNIEYQRLSLWLRPLVVPAHAKGK